MFPRTAVGAQEWTARRNRCYRASRSICPGCGYLPAAVPRLSSIPRNVSPGSDFGRRFQPRNTQWCRSHRPSVAKSDDGSSGTSAIDHAMLRRRSPQPAVRPSALEWKQALETARDSLRDCQANAQHSYDRSLPNCPWCARLDATGVDLFLCPRIRQLPANSRRRGNRHSPHCHPLYNSRSYAAVDVFVNSHPPHQLDTRPRTEMMNSEAHP